MTLAIGTTQTTRTTRPTASARISSQLVPVDPVKKKILVVLPENGFDATESSAPWKMLKAAGHQIVFATASGNRAKVDPMTVNGKPFSTGLQGLLGEKFLDTVEATAEGKKIFTEMSADPSFNKPIKFSDIDPAKFDGIVIPGGEGPGMIPFLDNKLLQSKVAGFFVADKPVAALCHGVLLAARAKDPPPPPTATRWWSATAITSPRAGRATPSRSARVS